MFLLHNFFYSGRKLNNRTKFLIRPGRMHDEVLIPVSWLLMAGLTLQPQAPPESPSCVLSVRLHLLFYYCRRTELGYLFLCAGYQPG